MSRPVLELEQLRLRYPGNDDWTLNGLDLTLEAGETLALVGSSGCGKSTVARAVLQLLPPGSRCEGRLQLTGSDPRHLDRSALRHLRGKAAGLVFQDPMTRLNPLMPIGIHLIDTLQAHRPESSARWRRQRAEELLERVGIGTGRIRAYPHELSGGMRQRLAIALAIALEPPLLIADEPTTSLDVAVAGQVMAELSGLCKELGSALLPITHDLAMAARWCDRMVMLYGGTIRAEGSVEQLLEDTGRTIIQSPRLKPETIERVEAVIRESEGVSIEQVSQPRQRLEDLFLDIVEQARLEQVETAGATESGQTADFLRGQGEGDDLIHSLTSDEVEPAPVRATEVTEPSADVAQRETTEQVVEGLTNAAPEPESRGREVKKTADRPKVDQSMIDDLIDGSRSSDDEDETAE